MRTTRVLRTWNRTKAEFVEIPVQYPPDTSLSCEECRYYDDGSGICLGVGSAYYMKKTPRHEFVPRYAECRIRLPPDLLSFVES
ncbi:MAG: hypothetical protein C4K48_02390 [Candidatus Thorarchaeota archaeon]|nr:MAG: hypothetical protein C4K48_02390 [Candidatus Thorarchaeota archaeon]